MSPQAMRSGCGALLSRSRLPCGLSTFLPAKWRGRSQLESPCLICALTLLGQCLPICQRVMTSFSSISAIVGCFPLANSCHLGLSGPRLCVLGPWLVMFTRVLSLPSKEGIITTLGTRMTVHEGSWTFAGPLALGHGSRILEGAHHRD